MRIRMRLFLVVTALSLLPRGFAQSVPNENSASQAPVKQISGDSGTIRINTSLVLVPVSVFDANGRAVKDLKLSDFAVLENGRAVAPDRLSEPGLSKLDMVLVFDVTGSTRTHFDFARQAATSFLKSLFRSQDTVSILCIASDPQILLKSTGSLETALDGLNKLKPFGGATAFFDSIFAATRLFRDSADEEKRRVMVVLSDGEDNFSTVNLAEALRAVQTADCVFYSINPGVSTGLSRVSMRGQQYMETLADQTGGEAFFAERIEDLSEIYKRIAAELQVQYLLSYYSPNPAADGSFRSIKVEVSGRPELKVRARKGYYAQKPVSR